MSTSGTTIWTMNRDAVIKGALRKLAVLPSGGIPTTSQYSDCSDSLNSIIKALQADGMPVWKIVTKTFNTLAGSASYQIGPSVTPSTTAFVAPQPLKVMEAFYVPSGGNNTPMNIYNRYDFQQLPTTGVSGSPVNLYCQPLGASNSTNLTLWPTPADSTTAITVHYQAPYEDMNASTDNFDFPAYWIQALVYLLAWAMSPEFGIPPIDRGVLQKEALYWKDQALSYGTEEGSLFLQPRSI